MLETFIDMLKGTPWWVYLIFGYLVFIGIKSRNTYTVSLSIVPILPLAILIWLMTTIFKYQDPWAAIPYFIGGLCIGMIIGFFVLYQHIFINLEKNTITFEGSWLMLPLLMSIFVVKYAFGYMNAIQHNFILAYPWAELVISGFIAGIFAGRLANIYYRYMKKA